jgi:hypothetical protein
MGLLPVLERLARRAQELHDPELEESIRSRVEGGSRTGSDQKAGRSLQGVPWEIAATVSDIPRNSRLEI